VGTEREDTAQRAPYLLTTLPLQQATQPASTKHRTLADDTGRSAGSQLVLPAQGIPGFGGLHAGQFTHSAGLLRVRVQCELCTGFWKWVVQVLYLVVRKNKRRQQEFTQPHKIPHSTPE
jgi:hypothetical protein